MHRAGTTHCVAESPCVTVYSTAPRGRSTTTDSPTSFRGHVAAAPLLLQLVQLMEDDALHPGEPITHVGKVVAGS